MKGKCHFVLLHNYEKDFIADNTTTILVCIAMMGVKLIKFIDLIFQLCDCE